MILSCRNGYINLIQIGANTISSDLSKALSYGLKKTKCLQTKLSTLVSYIDILSCYKVFTIQPAIAQRIVFMDNANPITIDVIAGTTWTFTSTATTADDIAREFYNFLWNQTDLISLGYTIEIVGDTVYVYAYTFDEEVSYRTSSNTVVTDITVTPNEILDIYNCHTFEEICAIISHGLELSKTTC